MRVRPFTVVAAAALAIGLAGGAAAAHAASATHATHTTHAPPGAAAPSLTAAPVLTAAEEPPPDFGAYWADLVVVAPGELPGSAKGFMVGHPDIEEVLVAEIRAARTGTGRARVLAADPDELAGFQRVFGEVRERAPWSDLRDGKLVPAVGAEEGFPDGHARVWPFGAFPVAPPARPPVPGVDAVAPARASDEANPGRANAALVSARWADREELREELLEHLPGGSSVQPVDTGTGREHRHQP